MSMIFNNSRCNLVEDVNISKGNWCKRRTKLERKLFILVFIFFLAFASLVAILCWFRFHSDKCITKGSFETSPPLPTEPLSTPKFHDDKPLTPGSVTSGYSETSPLPTSLASLSPPEPGKGICLTRDCIIAASFLINNMKSEVLPCVDFYEYACGRFMEYKSIPEMEINEFLLVAEKISLQIKEIVDSPEDRKDSELLRKIKEFYTSCMDENIIDEMGIKPLEELIEQVGGWPVVMGDKWNDSSFQWQELMFRFNDADVSPNSFLTFGVTEDLIDSSKYILTISNPKFALPISFYKLGMNSSLLNNYLDNFVQAAEYFGANSSRARMEMTDVLQMEIELSELLLNNDPVSNIRIKLSTLQELVPELNWKSYMERILSMKFDDSEMIFVLNKNYILNFTKVLSKRSPRTIANFAVGKVVRDMTLFVTEEFAELFNMDLKSERWEKCLNKTRTIFSDAIYYEYINKWFSNEKKSEVNEMVKHIKEEMMNMLRNAKWVDSWTLRKAEEKLSAMYAVVAYPDEILDYNKLAQGYDNFTVDDGAYFKNIRNYQKLQRDKEFSKLRQPVKHYDWKETFGITDVNAFYNVYENAIVVPVGILQGVFFNYERPEYMNFASIGSVIGHEITHGFDNRGRWYNKNGRFENWWQPEADQAFKELTKCLILQYNNYTSPEVNMKMNGKNCLNENIADNGGLKNAYHAYQRWVQKHGKEPRLPGLNLTTNQLFWISYANIWCSKASSETIKDQIENKVHTIARFRVNGPLSNMPEFARDFNCPLYSNMNPNERCAVW